MDPHWFGCPADPDQGNWPELTNKPGFLPFRGLLYGTGTFLGTGTFFDLLPVPRFFKEVCFKCKNSTFLIFKSDQDPDPHESDWFGSLDPEPHPYWDKNLDPDPPKPMHIHTLFVTSYSLSTKYRLICYFLRVFIFKNSFCPVNSLWCIAYSSWCDAHCIFRYLWVEGVRGVHGGDHSDHDT